MFTGLQGVRNALFGFHVNRLFFDKKETIAISLFLKERIALFALFVKSDESELLFSPF